MNEPEEPTVAKDLNWVEEVAALLPEESRVGWYQNVRPWLRMLPPDDEVAHLAYSMGYLALLTRTVPPLIATERARMAALVQRTTDEMAGALKTTGDYHQKLNERLSSLPAEIAEGLSPAALADQIVSGVRDQFLQSGVPEAGRLLKEQGDRLRQVVSSQSKTLEDFRQELSSLRDRVGGTIVRMSESADAARMSIDRWNREMREVQWLHLGWTFLTGLLLGALLYWWAFGPVTVPAQTHVSEINQPKPPAVASGKRTNAAPR